MCTRCVHKVDYMNNIQFRTANGGVSNKVRNAVKTQASTAVNHILDQGNIRFEYVPEKGCFCAVIAVDERTQKQVYLVLDLTVTDMHPSDRAERKSRAGKSKAKVTPETPNLF